MENNEISDVLKLSPQAMISFGRANGTGMRLFGSELEHNSVITMKISGCELFDKESGGVYYHPRKRHIVVEMSSIQFAELISNMNTVGVPCTLKELSGLRAPDIKKSESSLKRYTRKIDGTGIDIIKSLRNLKEIGNGVLPKNTSKKGRERFDSVINNAIQDIKSNLNFYVNMHKEELEKMTGEASVEVDAIIQSKLIHLGLQKMNEMGGITQLIKQEIPYMPYEEEDNEL